MSQLQVLWGCGGLSNAEVVSAGVREAVSTPTTGYVELMSKEPVDPATLVGLDAKLTTMRHDGTREWTFVIASARYRDTRSGLHRYECQLVHRLGLLALRKDVRAFQKVTLQQIVTDLLNPVGVSATSIKWKVDDNPVLDYVVQYRETDLGFLQRILSETGLIYVIAADGNVVFGDDTGDFGQAEVGSLELLEGDFGSGVSEFHLDFESTPDVYATSDYNCETPDVDLSQSVTLGQSVASEWFEYPGGFVDIGTGKRWAQRRAESFLCQQVTGRGRSESQRLAPGASFDLVHIDHDVAQQGYWVLEVEHRWQLRPVEGQVLSASYGNDFRCVPKRPFYRVPWNQVRPSVAGPLSAVVTTPGEEIHTDALGRSKVQFFWDRLNPRNDTASCWTRVLQLPIGGSLAVLRKDWEMLVRHVDGDPNRPVAIVRMDNAAHVAPYTYPSAGTALAWKTPSSPGAAKHNEFSMEDSGGKMGFLCNSAYDYSAQTLHCKTEKITVNDKLTVDVDHSNTVGADQKCTIGINWTKTVSKNADETVTANRKLAIGAAETVTISKNLAESVTGSDTEKVGASYIALAGMNISRTTMGKQSLTVGGALMTGAGLGVSVAVAGSKAELVGGAKITAAKGGISETVMGGMMITVGGVCANSAKANRSSASKGKTSFNVGGAMVVSGGSKVQIHAKTITIKAGALGNFVGSGGIMTLTPGAGLFVGMVTVDASGTLKIIGAPNLAG